jgi:hypothetical protein
VKVHIAGDTPMERLTNFTKKIVAVPKSEVNALEKKWRSRKAKRKSTKR